MVHLIWWQTPLSNNPKIEFCKNKDTESTSLMLFLRNVFTHLEDINAKKLPFIFKFGWKALLLISSKWIYILVQLPQDIYEKKMLS